MTGSETGPAAPGPEPGAPRWPSRLTRSIGHRGATLLLLGGIYVWFGAGQLTMPLPDRSGLRLLLWIAPLPVWLWLNIAAGLLAMAAAFIDDEHDWWGFTALTAAMTPWAASYFASWLLHDNSRGWVPAALYAAFGSLPVVLVGYHECPDRRGRE